MRPQPGDTCDGPTESERLAMLAFYDLPGSESACDCHEDWRQITTSMSSIPVY